MCWPRSTPLTTTYSRENTPPLSTRGRRLDSAGLSTASTARPRRSAPGNPGARSRIASRLTLTTGCVTPATSTPTPLAAEILARTWASYRM